MTTLSDKSVKFTVDSLLLYELGERLVTKNYIALAELVKNSYDADALKVTVVFLKASQVGSASELCIIDDGHGMTFQQVKDYWMRIATPNKLRNPISQRFGRKKTGDKGIGRFACRRLAKKLILDSVARNDSTKQLEHTRVEFDWAKFQPGQDLTEIPSTYESEVISDGRIGLTLRLKGLNEVWTQRDFDVLRRQVLGLSAAGPIRRRGFEEDLGFEIILHATEFSMGKGKLADQVMTAGWGLLRGSVSSKGIAILKLEALEIGKAEFELPDSYAEIPGVNFEIAIIIYSRDCIRDTSTLTLGLIDEIFEFWSGVRVFLDGFRVYPYGDPGDDWLEIDKDVAKRIRPASETFRRVSESLVGVDHSTVLLEHPRNRNLIGRVFVSNLPEPILEVTMNREGFLESVAFQKLKMLIRQGLEWSTIYYSYARYKQQQRKVAETVAEFQEKLGIPRVETEIEHREEPVIESALNVLKLATRENVKDLSKESREELEKRAGSAIHVIDESFTYVERQLIMLRTAASSGALMLTFMHEAKDVASKLDTHATELEAIASKLDEKTREKMLRLSESMRNTRDRLDRQIELFGSISKGLRVTDRERIIVKQVFDEVNHSFQGLALSYGFSIDSHIPDSLRTGPMVESELYSILINLISNAVKVVIASDTGKRILVEGTEEENETVIRVFDDGIGLPKELRDAVFEPLAADPDGRLYKRLRSKIKYEDLLVIGEGTGMGLAIVKDILGFYGKKVHFIDVTKPWSTCVEARLP